MRTTWKQIGSSANRISPPRRAPRRVANQRFAQGLRRFAPLASPLPHPKIKKRRASVPPAPVPLFVNFVDFRKFSVGDGGGYYMGPVQLILSFSCFRGLFREFRVMIFTPEESLTRNRNTPAHKRGAKRPRMYSKASPPGDSQVSSENLLS